jgi:hypothetical protein
MSGLRVLFTYVGFDVLTAATVMNSVLRVLDCATLRCNVSEDGEYHFTAALWDVTPYTLVSTY